MRLHMIIWLYKPVYLKRKHEEDVYEWNIWDENWAEKEL